MFQVLNKPFPNTRFTLQTIMSSFVIGCFVALFLSVFQPFGISEWQTHNKFLKLIGFGLVSFTAQLVAEFIIKNLLPVKLREDNWKVWHEIASIVFVLLLIAIGNLLYGNKIHIMPISVKGFAFALLTTILIGVFPVAIHVITKYNKLLHKNTHIAEEVNVVIHPEVVFQKEEPKKIETSLIKLIAENEKDIFETSPDNIIYIESADNYSVIHFKQNNQLKKQILRSSLKRIESQNLFKFIARCHRAYIVNLQWVDKIEGNAAGYLLHLKDSEITVPVSRNYGPEIISKLKEQK